MLSSRSKSFSPERSFGYSLLDLPKNPNRDADLDLLCEEECCNIMGRPLNHASPVLTVLATLDLAKGSSAWQSPSSDSVYTCARLSIIAMAMPVHNTP